MAGKRQTIKLTKKALSDLPLGLGWVNVSDPDIARLMIYSGSEIKTLYLRRRIEGQNLYLRICNWEKSLSPEQIRKEATKVAAKVVDGVNPTKERKAVESKSVTLGEVFDRYIGTRTKGKNAIKKSTEEQYRFSYKTDLKKWEGKPLIEITGDDAEKMHLERSKTSKTRANMATRLLRQIFKFAMEVYRDEKNLPIITYNPADRVSNLKLQNKIPRRTGHIKKEDLKRWFQAVKVDSNEAVVDLLIFTVLTGLRKSEAGQLTWDRVDLDKKTFKIQENKSDRPFQVPLSDYLHEMLDRRKKSAGVRKYVFPAGDKSSYLKDWRGSCARVTQRTSEDEDGNKLESIVFTPHDLRRTFITVAESLDISPYAIKALVNHALPSDDVTGGYIQIDVERLRKPMQRITDIILGFAEEKKTAEILQMEDHHLAG